jgi:hypothetical protein
LRRGVFALAVGERGMTPRDGNLIETVKLLGNVAGQGGPDQGLNQHTLARQIEISVGLVNAPYLEVRRRLVEPVTLLPCCKP